MQDQLTVTGMVLSSAPVGDYDRRLVLLTKERGKITVFARGARKPTSAWQAASRPFAFGHFSLYPGKNAYTLRQADISQYFEELSADIEAVSYGFYFLELASYYARENLDGSGVLNLLYASFRALTKKVIPYSLIRFITEVRMMWENGEFPGADACAACKKELTGEGIFHPQRASFYCKECGRQVPGGMMLSRTAIYTYQYVIATPMQRLFAFQVSEEVQKELAESMSRYMSKYLDQRFKSLEVLESLQ